MPCGKIAASPKPRVHLCLFFGDASPKEKHTQSEFSEGNGWWMVWCGSNPRYEIREPHPKKSAPVNLQAVHGIPQALKLLAKGSAMVRPNFASFSFNSLQRWETWPTTYSSTRIYPTKTFRILGDLLHTLRKGIQHSEDFASKLSFHLCLHKLNDLSNSANRLRFFKAWQILACCPARECRSIALADAHLRMSNFQVQLIHQNCFLANEVVWTGHRCIVANVTVFWNEKQSAQPQNRFEVEIFRWTAEGGTDENQWFPFESPFFGSLVLAHMQLSPHKLLTNPRMDIHQLEPKLAGLSWQISRYLAHTLKTPAHGQILTNLSPWRSASKKNGQSLS